jgi:DedD protein
MAASKSTESSATELEIKRRGRRRLIGAITLGLLAIVFLPMIFDSEPKRAGDAGKAQEIAVQVPSRDNQPPLSAPLQVPNVAPVANTPAPEAVKAAPQAAPARQDPSTVSGEPPKLPVVASSTAKPPEKPVPKEVAKEIAKSPAKTEKVEKPAKVAPVKDGFVVQIGVYTKAENADKEVSRVKDAKLPVYTDTIPVKAGNATRVRVGPYATREKAEAALAQIKLAGGDGKIVPTK